MFPKRVLAQAADPLEPGDGLTARQPYRGTFTAPVTRRAALLLRETA